MRQEVESTNIGNLIGPIELEGQWHIFQLMDRRAVGVQSLETLRPRIIDWLRYQEVTQLEERLARDARVERLRQPDESVEPGGEVTAPDDAEPVRPTTPEPDANAPPFPFPMGPGGVTGNQTPNPAPQVQAPPAQQPAATPPRPQPQTQPAQETSAAQEEAGGTQ
jgi:peptidyl-prolyl cis-trans isomerase C